MASIGRTIARSIKRNPEHRIKALRTIAEGKYGVEAVQAALAKKGTK